MNMQNKLYTIQFFSPPDDQFTASTRAVIAEPRNSQISWYTQKRPNSQRSLNSQKREEQIPIPWPTPIHKLSMTPIVWTVSIGQLGLAARLCCLPAPAHPLISWTWEAGESLWFHNHNRKHQCYQRFSRTKSKTQQLLGGRLTLSQLKPGQCRNIWKGFFVSLNNKLHLSVELN